MTREDCSHRRSAHGVDRTSDRTVVGILAILCLAALCAEAAVGAQEAVDGDDARNIVNKAFERSGTELRAVAGRYRARMTSEAREFDGNGRVTEEERVEWELIPIDDRSFTRRIAINGRPLTVEERAREDGRQEEFRRELRRLRAGDLEREEDENAVVFDEELISRYDLTLEGEEDLRNRPSYRIAFVSRHGELPVRRQIDRALNKAQGVIWIDRETLEVARLEYALVDRVRLWWGLVGTIHRFRGSIDRGPVLDGIWADLQQENYGDIRLLFARSRHAWIRRWRDYEWTDAQELHGGAAGTEPDSVDGGAR